MASLIHLGEMQTDGERRTAEALKAKLPSGWVVFANKTLALPRHTREIDFIVVADNHVFLLDEKGTAGQITGTTDWWRVGSGETRQNPLNKLDTTARILAGYLRDTVSGVREDFGNTPFVNTGVILSSPDVLVSLSDPRKDRVFCLSDVDSVLARLDSQGGCELGGSRQGILQFFRGLPPGPSKPDTIGLYRVVEEEAPGPSYRCFRAEDTAGRPRRVKLYSLEGMSPEQRENQRRLAVREYRTVDLLAGLGLAVKVDAPFPFDDRYLAAAQEVSEAPTLHRFLMDERPGTEDLLRLASATLHSLSRFHGMGIVHRNVTPDAILIRQEGDAFTVSFADFDYAQIPGDATVGPALAEVHNSYQAPELRTSPSLANRSTDLFALGIVFAEMFADVPADGMRTETDGVRIPPLALDPPFIESDANTLRDIFAVMTEVDQSKRFDAPDKVLELLNALLGTSQRREAAPPPPTTPVQVDLPRHADAPTVLFQRGDVVADQWEVEKVLKAGGTANTYLVRDVVYPHQRRYVLKQIKNRDWVTRYVGPEYRTLMDLPNPPEVFPRVHEALPADRPFHLRMDYIEGPSLDDLSSEFPWSAERVMQFAEPLLEGLIYLEDHNTAHRDVSARNIIVSADGPRLIDFGLAAPADASNDTQVGTVAYRAPELDRPGEGWNPTCDTYALGVVLHWCFAGRLPFVSHDGGVWDKAHMPAMPAGLSDRDRAVWSAIQRAIQPDRKDRYQSATAFLDSLHSAMSTVTVDAAEGEWVVNSWVRGIQGLYRNSAVGNADNRGLDTEFAQDTYVDTRLDTDLLPQVLEGRYWAVFLSGNPGDGKTAFLERLMMRLEELGAEFDSWEDDANGWSATLNGHRFIANYDASESSRGRRSNEILEELLRGLAGDVAPADPHATVLIAINDGKLREVMLKNPKFGWLGKQVYRLLNHPDWTTDPHVVLVDLKQRALVGESLETAPGASLFDRTVTTLLADRPEQWGQCHGCRAMALCPMRFNRDALMDPVSGPSARARLQSLFQWSHLRGERHLTMRDLRSAVAYIVAGTTRCEDIHKEAESGRRPPGWHDRLYFSAPFTMDASGDETLRELGLFDPASQPTPRLDRFLHFHRLPDEACEFDAVSLPFGQRSHRLLEGATLSALGRSWYAFQKRRLQFEGNEEAMGSHEYRLPAWQHLFPYRHAEAFLLAVTGRADLDEIRNTLCEAISRSDGIRDPQQYGRYLCIATGRSDKHDFTIFKRFPREHFACEVVAARGGRWMETLPNTLRLSHRLGDAALDIRLDLFEILMRFSEGYLAGAEEQEPFVIDLSQFKTRLLNHEANELILMESGRRLHHVRQESGVIHLVDTDAVREVVS